MKIVIFGAGAMGCLIGGKLLQAGEEVIFIARGAQLDALRHQGLLLQSGDKREHFKVEATDNPAACGAADILFITTKSYHVPTIAAQILPLLHSQTVILPALNGIPWWYFYAHSSDLRGRQLRSLDPEGAIARHIPAEHILGCVNYLAAQLTAPARVDYVDNFTQSLVIGELDGSSSQRLDQVSAIFKKAGLDPVTTDAIRSAVWHKLWGNIAFNPISALTHATMDKIVQGYDDHDLVLAVMNEARHIAEKLGIVFAESPHARIEAVALRVGHKTSMLQDIEQGKRTEIEAIVGAVREIGLCLEDSMPYLNSLYTLVKLKERFYQPSLQADQAGPSQNDLVPSLLQAVL